MSDSEDRMKRDQKTPVQNMRSKLAQLSRRQKLIIGGGIGAFVFLLLVIGVTTVVGVGSANRQAAAFETKLDEYISKLQKTNGSITQLRPIVTTAPELGTNLFGGLSGDYRRASAKQVALTVHQQEVFRYIPDFKQSDYLADLREFTTVFSRSYGSNSPIDKNFSSFVLTGDDVNLYKRQSIRLSDSRTSYVFGNYKERIQELSVGTYSDRAKKDIISRIEAAQELEKQYKKNLESADSYGEVRALNARHLVELQQPRYDPIYGYAALNGIQASSFKLSTPAVQSLAYINKNMSGVNTEDAKTMAYMTLYGHVASYNTPKSAASAPSNRESAGVTQYALSRLDAVLHDDALTSNSARRNAARSKLSVTYNAYASLPYGNDVLNPPSAALKNGVFYKDLTVDTSQFTGLTDVIRQLKETGTSGRSIKGASVDINAYNDYRKFAYSLYPTSILPKEVEAFKKANDSCIESRLEYTRAADKTIGLQFKEAQKVAAIEKEVRSIQASGDTSKAGRLVELRTQVRSGTDKVSKLQAELEPALKKQNEALERCKPSLGKSLEALNSKTKDLPAMYQSAKSTAEALYKNDVNA